MKKSKMSFIWMNGILRNWILEFEQNSHLPTTMMESHSRISRNCNLKKKRWNDNNDDNDNDKPWIFFPN